MEHGLTGARRPRRLVIVALLGLVITGLVAVNAAPAAAAPEADWTILGSDSGTAVVDGPQRAYALHNVTHGRNLRYGEREYGINLVWADAGDTRHLISFHRQAGAGPLSYDEPVAIEVNRHGFLRYGEREYGINLVWSATPVYEWRLRGGQGTVTEGETVALYNVVRGSAMVYAERSYGINLRWSADVQAATPTTATVELGYQFGETTTPGLRCTGRIVWRLTPVSLTGTDGSATAVTVDQQFDEFAEALGAGRYVCRFTARVSDSLRTGRWRVTLENEVTCEVPLHAGLNSVKFTQTAPRCSTDGDFPPAQIVPRVVPEGGVPMVAAEPVAPVGTGRVVPRAQALDPDRLP